ncbi:metal-binding protein [Fulvivirga sp. M361]|uniref:Ada metal-binding domain-containing protein n=1 Tax=Fulvivirga sp. M361 TaxID=2594266 RepID=UPI00117A0010|nr:Ada metal-binding domain-containing protein [Fulvivirga sp. M361]TRX59902.1 metal-binding protein [Fulvivirga sp. M361]
MVLHDEITNFELNQGIRKGSLRLAGNKKLKIYGSLGCRSGKRLKRENRVFFTDQEEALKYGYRPCAHCLRETYKRWRNGPV